MGAWVSRPQLKFQHKISNRSEILLAKAVLGFPTHCCYATCLGPHLILPITPHCCLISLFTSDWLAINPRTWPMVVVRVLGQCFLSNKAWWANNDDDGGTESKETEDLTELLFQVGWMLIVIVTLPYTILVYNFKTYWQNKALVFLRDCFESHHFMPLNQSRLVVCVLYFYFLLLVS